MSKLFCHLKNSEDSVYDRRNKTEHAVSTRNDREAVLVLTFPVFLIRRLACVGASQGEAISWHVREVLSERSALRDVRVQRVAFHEITKVRGAYK